MSDFIHLLPDSIANQIAAGEVVQRPASAVKELLENAIDASADHIQLIVKDAGKSLIQVIDNGKGMSETDARMCFERHATSKIREAQDIFTIRSMGFRGEALASIAAIAQVELKTRTEDQSVGSLLRIEGSAVQSQEACQCSKGSSFAIKNLFYNVPARRQFLKSDAVELRHITEEFFRVALIHPEAKFSFYHQDKLLYTLEKCVPKQRIIQLFGNNYSQRLVPVEQAVNYVTISGYIGKPEHALKTKGEQYFFVNQRFIKHPYLHHAVCQAFDELIAANSYPSYFIHFDIDPRNIDINIHPTKTEVKFLDEKLIYGVLLAATKKAIGVHNLAPSLDFETVPEYQPGILPRDYKAPMPSLAIDPRYNPFASSSGGYSEHGVAKAGSGYLQQYADLQASALPSPSQQQNIELSTDEGVDDYPESGPCFQFEQRYIVASSLAGILCIDQEKAHQRILFEEFMVKMESPVQGTQSLLFPQTLEFSARDADLIEELQGTLEKLGWSLSAIGRQAFLLNARPAQVSESDAQAVLEGILENFKSGLLGQKRDQKTNLALSMAKRMGIKAGQSLGEAEQKHLILSLFSCKLPHICPLGTPVFTLFSEEEINNKLKNQTYER